MTEPVQRGKPLSIFLGGVFLVALVGIASYVILWARMHVIFPAWAVYVLFTIAILRLPAVVAVWFWSKSGVVAYVGLTIVAIAVLLRLGQKFSLLGFLGAVVLVALVWSKWKHMHWGLALRPKL